jgi:drug/metabolite transporter (DMT)-like permease
MEFNQRFPLNSLEVYSMAIGANLTFSTASMIFSFYARSHGPMWINQIKVIIAFLAFTIAMLLWNKMVALEFFPALLLLSSGLVGLCLGDILLFRAYATLGAGRSLVLFSFEPLFLGIYGYFFLGQTFTVNQTLAVICMVICIYVFMLERNKLTGAWDFKSFLYAFSGIFLDAVGVMLSRSAYEASPELQTFEVNVIRCLGALLGFFLLGPRSYPKLMREVWALNFKNKAMIVGASLGGCFISLTLYLAALKYAHVGTLTAIAITGPVWVSLLECLYYRRLPNRYLITAFAFFLLGFGMMVYS